MLMLWLVLSVIGHDGRLLRNFLPVVSLKKFLAHRDIHLVPSKHN